MANIVGTAGNDILTSTGVDVLSGLKGDDTYYIDGITDVVVEAANSGNDAIYFTSNFDFGIATAYTLALNVERLGLSALDLSANPTFTALNKFVVNGNALNNVISIGDSGSKIRVLAAAGNDTVIGGTGNDEIDGGLGIDYILGNAGSDTLYGGGDVVVDSLEGGTGADTYVLQNTKDKITEVVDGSVNTILLASNYSEAALSLAEITKYNYASSYIRKIDASNVTKALTLTANASIATSIVGGLGNDIIYGGAAVDTLAGGRGNDTYLVTDSSDTIVENADGGIDTLKVLSSASSVTLNLANNVENIDASLITNNATLNGNTLANSITGGKGNDTLYGGNDVAADALAGGAGSDTYIIRDLVDVINEKGTGAGEVDTVKLFVDYDNNGVKNDTLVYTLNNKAIEVLDGSSLLMDSALTGNATTATRLIGSISNDTLTGGTGNDVLIGGLGTDSLVGGGGNDTYLVDDLVTDTIVEGANAGSDTIKLSGAVSVGTVDLRSVALSNFENVDASAVSGNIILWGNSATNTLIGTNGSDIIHGGIGADTLAGGKGSDIYFVDNSGNKVLENANEGYDKVILTNTYNSTSYSLISNVEFLDATTAKQGLTLTGSATTAMTIFGSYYNDKITGSTGDDIIMGYNGNDAIYGLAGNDNLQGDDGADYIDGGAGDDHLYGGGDVVADTLVGGDGNDTYTLKDTKDIIRDTSLTGNKIELNSFFAEDSFSLANNAVGYNYSAAAITHVDAQDVDHGITLTGNNTLFPVVTVIPATETTKAKTVTTYIGVNELLQGTRHDDFITSYSGDDQLWGSYGNATSYGGGDDTLYGGAGRNTLMGGIGDDTYIIDGLATTTTVTEMADCLDSHGSPFLYGTDTIKLVTNNGAFTKGVDQVKLNTQGTLNGLETFEISLANYAEVEILDGSLITGTKLKLTGSTITKIDSQKDERGLFFGNTIIGGSADDTIMGGANCDELYGGGGNDSIEGGGGLNTLYGGYGDDTYKISLKDEEAIVITNPDKTTTSNAWSWSDTDGESVPTLWTEISDTSGIDTIVLTGKDSYSKDHYEHFSLTLPDDVDNLDASAISKDLGLLITGNDLDNFIIGGTGSDYIEAGDGDDTIYDYKNYVKDGVTYHYGNIVDAGNGNNTIITGDRMDIVTALNGDDFLYDYDGDNLIDLGDGNNRIYVGSGHDDITTGTGNDYILAGDGKDTISSGAGNDTIDGGLSDDSIVAGAGDDSILGFEGNDTIEAGTGNDTIDAGTGANLINFDDGGDKDLILSTNANDIIEVISGIDTDDILFYTDNLGNFYMDYTEGDIGSDIVEIAAGGYNDSTTIQVGSSTIHINTIIGQLNASTSGLESAAIAALDAADESAQAAILTWST